MRAGYSAVDTAAAIEAAAGKASLRRLQIGMEFTIAEHGFRFLVKPGVDIYVLRHPDSGWIAINAIRLFETYLPLFKAVLLTRSIGGLDAGAMKPPLMNMCGSWGFLLISSAKSDRAISLK